MARQLSPLSSLQLDLLINKSDALALVGFWRPLAANDSCKLAHCLFVMRCYVKSRQPLHLHVIEADLVCQGHMSGYG